MGVPLSPPPPGETRGHPIWVSFQSEGFDSALPTSLQPPTPSQSLPTQSAPAPSVPIHSALASTWKPPRSTLGVLPSPRTREALVWPGPAPPSLSAGPQVSSQVNSRSPGRAPRPLTCGTEPAGTGIPL